MWTKGTVILSVRRTLWDKPAFFVLPEYIPKERPNETLGRNRHLYYQDHIVLYSSVLPIIYYGEREEGGRGREREETETVRLRDSVSVTNSRKHYAPPSNAFLFFFSFFLFSFSGGGGGGGGIFFLVLARAFVLVLRS